MTAKQRATRAGFTLVEILVVVAIIAVLAALLLTAVGGVRSRIRVTTTRADMSQLQTGLDTFKQAYGFYPPSHITISDPAADSARTTVGVWRFRWPVHTSEPEFALLRRMFPRWNPAPAGDTTSPFRFMPDGATLDTAWMKQFVPSGSSVPLAAPYAFLAEATNPRLGIPGATPLDANQALVLFIGGPAYVLDKTTTFPNQTTPVAYGLESFGTGWDTAGPVPPLAASNAKKGPFWDIPPSKLTTDFGGAVPRLVDGWGTPFAYFVASSNNYDARVPFPWPPPPSAGQPDWPAPATYDGNPATNFGNGPGAAATTGDRNNDRTFTAHPYGSGGKWMNPGTFQLLSAGADKLFGPGSYIATAGGTPTHVWDAKNPQGAGVSATYYGEGGGQVYATGVTQPKLARGTDDLATFNADVSLGTGQ